MASVLGSTSANTSTSTVVMPVEIATPQAPGNDLPRVSVISEPDRMLIRLLPKSTAPIISACRSRRRLTRPAALSPSRSSWCIRARLAPVSAVSAAENRPDTANSTMITRATTPRAAVMEAADPRS